MTKSHNEITLDEKAFEAFMDTIHTHGTSGLGYRKAIGAYLAHCQPAAVSLEKCARALCGFYFDSGEALTLHAEGVIKQVTRDNYIYAYWYQWKDKAKAVLDAAEVPYAE